ncbi:MAG: nucleotide exchange factor GrpE [Alkalibacterium sp.]|nr:nucleotide exchange factor GrpE [Alkalibacterium sp.]
MKEKENQRKQEEKAEAETTVSTEEEVEANDSSEETDQTELEKVYKELDETTDRYLRLQAELANIRKRNQRERQDLLKYSSQSLAQKLVPVLDNLERALTIEADTEAGQSLKKESKWFTTVSFRPLKTKVSK